MDMVSPLPEDLIEIFEEDLAALRLGQLRGQNLGYAVFETQVCGEEQSPHAETCTAKSIIPSSVTLPLVSA